MPPPDHELAATRHRSHPAAPAARAPGPTAGRAAVVARSGRAPISFRLGFERWFSAQSGATTAGCCRGLVTVYLLVFQGIARCPGTWRFSGFGGSSVWRWRLQAGRPVGRPRRAYGCTARYPRAGLHPLFTLMLLAMIRAWATACSTSMRSRISGSSWRAAPCARHGRR